MKKYIAVLCFLSLLSATAEAQNCLIAEYLFTGNTLDTGGNDYHGDPFYVSLHSDRNGADDQAYLFDGDSAHITLHQNVPLISSPTATIIAWARMDGRGGGTAFSNPIFAQGADTSNGTSTIALLSENNAGDIRFIIQTDGDTAEMVDYPAPAYGTWHHYVGVCDGTTMQIYLDGLLVASEDFSQGTGDLTQNIDHVEIGQQGHNGLKTGAFNGVIDEVRIYSCALSAEEILLDYENTAALSGPIALCQDVLLALDSSGKALLLPEDINAGSYHPDFPDSLLVLSISDSLFDCSRVGIHEVSLTVSINEDDSTCVSMVDVQDLWAPEIVSDALQIYLDSAGQASVSHAQLEALVYDACGLDSLSLSQYDYDCSHLGVNPVLLYARDIHQNDMRDTIMVEILDTIAPTIEVIDEAIHLWSPNHKYEHIDVQDLIVSVADNCPADHEDAYIRWVSSDEAENGKGDGNTTDDIIIDNNCQTVHLRAERLGNSNGRVYSIHLALADGSNNSASDTCYVYVPHNPKREVIDDGVAYEKYCSPEMETPEMDSLEVETIEEEIIELTDHSDIIRIYPNPTKGVGNIAFMVRENAFTSLTLYNMYGAKMLSLYAAEAEVDMHYNVRFDSASLPSGIYFIELLNGNEILHSSRLLIQK